MKMTRRTGRAVLTVLVFFFCWGIQAELGAQKPSKKTTSGTTSSERSKRSKAVSYMRSMATISWEPKEDITYWSNAKLKYQAGTTYRGLPYTQYGRNTSLDEFKTFLKREKGKRFYTGPTQAGKYRGSDCSSSVSLAWKQVQADFPICSTGVMFPERNAKIVKVGDYEVSSGSSTRQIVNSNGKEKMFAAYSQLKAGDALLSRNNGSGHVRLVSKVTSKNKKEQKVLVIEQCGYNLSDPTRKNTTWRVQFEYSYEDLFKTAYIPISLKAFRNP